MRKKNKVDERSESTDLVRDLKTDLANLEIMRVVYRQQQTD